MATHVDVHTPATRVHLEGRGTATIRDFAGPAGAPTLLLLHGWTATADLNWGASYLRLAERFRVVALDHRGHGDGIRSDEVFTLEDCADDAAQLLRSLEIDQAIVVGYSMGGPIAQLMWRRHREQVAGLVLCATADHFVETRLEHLLAPATGLATSMSRHLPAGFWTRVAVESARYRSRGDADLREQARRVAGSHCWKAVFEAGRAIAAFDSRSWVGGVDVPTTVVATMQDHLVPTGRQLDLADRIARSTLHRVRGHHEVCVHQPGEFVPVLAEACRVVATRAAINAGRPSVTSDHPRRAVKRVAVRRRHDHMACAPDTIAA